MTSLELFEHRYNKGQKFSWLEMLDFAEAYASQSPEPNTVTGEQIDNASRERAKAFFTPEDDLEMWDLGFHHGAKWALQQPQAVGVSEDEIIDILTRLVDLKIYKDKYGKDDLYLKEQPILWEKARSILELLNQKK